MYVVNHTKLCKDSIVTVALLSILANGNYVHNYCITTDHSELSGSSSGTVKVDSLTENNPDQPVIKSKLLCLL